MAATVLSAFATAIVLGVSFIGLVPVSVVFV